jgi:hypothetical protein
LEVGLVGHVETTNDAGRAFLSPKAS